MAMALDLASSRYITFSSAQSLRTGLNRVNAQSLALPLTSRSRKACRLVSAVAGDSEAESAPSPAPGPAQEEDPQPAPAKKPVFSMKKGQIVRVDKEKYLNSIEYYAVAHPKYFKGLDYIYEDRGEILDVRMFEAGEYALVSWVGISTSPAWLPTYMLIKSEKLAYRRQ